MNSVKRIKMIKKIKKNIRNIVRVVDYPIFVFVLPFCFVGLLFAIPWIFRQRRIWKSVAKGSRKALILLSVTTERVINRGYEHLLPFRNPSIKWIGVLDAANSLKTKTKITNDLYLITWKSPKIVRFLEKTGLVATSIIFRELVGIFKITSYCLKEQIGVLRAYKHNYPALQAYLVSSLSKFPSSSTLRVITS